MAAYCSLVFLAFVIVVALFVGIVSADDYGSNNPSDDTYKLAERQEEEDFGAVKVQGGVYCRNKQGGKLIPLPGAMARITCMAKNEKREYAGQFSVVSRQTDINGYFLINLSRYELESITLRNCNVHLETHPPGVCNIPTDVNNGLTGASLTHYRHLEDSSRLYSLPPFIYDASSY